MTTPAAQDSSSQSRVHLDLGSGSLLRADSAGAVSSIDLSAELSTRGDDSPLAVLRRHLAPDGVVTVDVFGQTKNKITNAEWDELDRRAEEMGWNRVDRTRVVKAKWSLETPNRSNIVVRNDSWDLERFRNSNPVGLWNHESGGFCTTSDPRNVVARWIEVRHERKSPKSDLIGFAEFVPKDIHHHGEVVMGLYRFGALNTFSPGFLVRKEEAPGDEDTFAAAFTDCELIELSFVIAPRHPDAVRQALNAGAFSMDQLKSCIGRHLEVAYGAGCAALSFRQLEAVSSLLGLESPKAIVEMSASKILELKAPTSAFFPTPRAAALAALRATDEDQDDVEGGLEAHGLPVPFADPGWEKFGPVDRSKIPVEMLLAMAAAAGVSPELVEAAHGDAKEPEGSGQASDEEAGEDEQEDGGDDEAQEFSDEDLKAIENAVAEGMKPTVAEAETQLGILVVPQGD